MELINRSAVMPGVIPVVSQVTKQLSNPNIIPQQVVLSGTIAAGGAENHFYFDDALSMASQNSEVGGATGKAMTPSNYSAATLKSYLQTYALVIGSWNYETTKSSELAKNMKMIYNAIDGNGAKKNLFTAQTKSNMQNDPNLLNTSVPFVWTLSGALRISASPDAGGGSDLTNTFTFNVVAAVPYAQLDEVLAALAIPDRSPIK